MWYFFLIVLVHIILWSIISWITQITCNCEFFDYGVYCSVESAYPYWWTHRVSWSSPENFAIHGEIVHKVRQVYLSIVYVTHWSHYGNLGTCSKYETQSISGRTIRRWTSAKISMTAFFFLWRSPSSSESHDSVTLWRLWSSRRGCPIAPLSSSNGCQRISVWINAASSTVIRPWLKSLIREIVVTISPSFFADRIHTKVIIVSCLTSANFSNSTTKLQIVRLVSSWDISMRIQYSYGKSVTEKT